MTGMVRLILLETKETWFRSEFDNTGGTSDIKNICCSGGEEESAG